ncbi:GNAT family N-acetyltransferase [Sphingomicrobium sp. XHP0239]|uniref:GNAT family N-acetyltransferase n=1 Tax=Sphingomicrobium maritimum TaxID=3133972 RepID=UPI0031CCCAC0
MDIQFNEENGRGRWHLQPKDSDEAAEMTFSRTNDKLIMIDHTYVPPAARGQGLVEKLAERAYKYAKEKGWRIAPVCPFFKAEAQRHGWDDIVEG